MFKECSGQSRNSALDSLWLWGSVPEEWELFLKKATRQGRLQMEVIWKVIDLLRNDSFTWKQWRGVKALFNQECGLYTGQYMRTDCTGVVFMITRRFIKWDPGAWILPEPFLCYCMTMSKLGYLLSLKASKPLHLIVHYVGSFTILFCKKLCENKTMEPPFSLRHWG